MVRAQRATVAFWLALMPCLLGFKGCYFGNDEVPLGSNARRSGAGTDGIEPPASGSAGGEGGASSASGPPGRGEPVFVLESTLQFVRSSDAGAPSQL